MAEFGLEMTSEVSWSWKRDAVCELLAEAMAQSSVGQQAPSAWCAQGLEELCALWSGCWCHQGGRAVD